MRIPRRTLVLAAACAAACSAGAATGAALLLTSGLRRRIRNRQDFAGKVVLITGSSRGLGLALAEEFGRAGARLVLTARDPAELQRARQYLLRRGAIHEELDAAVISCDVTDPAQVHELIEQATSRFGAIDVLVNNAGTITVGPVENLSLESFHETMDVNFYGMLHTTLAVLPQMLARHGGAIVNICSIGSKIPVPHLLPYTASKFAAAGFSEGLHIELRSKGIRVTTVCPGLMRTGSYVQAKFVGDQQREHRWFALSASLPIVSTSAAHAARRIRLATARGETELILTPQAAVAAKAFAHAPSLVSWALAQVNQRILPPADGHATGQKQGKQVKDSAIRPLIHFGRRAAQQYNQGV
jgi:NAD(P)-dependent dehydrogenase (short-subunit alcohol dehydrogenase family)